MSLLPSLFVLLLIISSKTAPVRGQVLKLEEKLAPSNRADGDRFGSSVSLATGTLVVGAPAWSNGDGRVGYATVYHLRRATQDTPATWAPAATLMAPDSDAPDACEEFSTSGFGSASAVSLTGRRPSILIGAYEHNRGHGAAYLYSLDESGEWAIAATLTPQGADATDRCEFGRSVALDGDLALVGAPQDDQQGAAYIYRDRGPQGGGWVLEERLTAPDGSSQDRIGFGKSVALSEGVALVGAQYWGTPVWGAAYVFERGEAGWARSDWLQPVAPDCTAATDVDCRQPAYLGSDVSLSGNLAAVSAKGLQQVFLYSRAGDGRWEHTGSVSVPPDSSSGPTERFGTSVSVGGAALAVGAPYSGEAGLRAGSVYLYPAAGDGDVDSVVKLLGADGDREDEQGWRVAVGGGGLAIGARGADRTRGAVYLLQLDRVDLEAGAISPAPDGDLGWGALRGEQVAVSKSGPLPEPFEAATWRVSGSLTFSEASCEEVQSQEVGLQEGVVDALRYGALTAEEVQILAATGGRDSCTVQLALVAMLQEQAEALAGTLETVAESGELRRSLQDQGLLMEDATFAAGQLGDQPESPLLAAEGPTLGPPTPAPAPDGAGLHSGAHGWMTIAAALAACLALGRLRDAC